MNVNLIKPLAYLKGKFIPAYFAVLGPAAIAGEIGILGVTGLDNLARGFSHAMDWGPIGNHAIDGTMLVAPILINTGYGASIGYLASKPATETISQTTKTIDLGKKTVNKIKEKELTLENTVETAVETGKEYLLGDHDCKISKKVGDATIKTGAIAGAAASGIVTGATYIVGYAAGSLVNLVF